MPHTDSIARCWRSLRKAGFETERRPDSPDLLTVTVPGLESRLFGPLADPPFFRLFDDRFVITRTTRRGRERLDVTLDYWRAPQLLLHAVAAIAVPLSLPELFSPVPGNLLTLLSWLAAFQLALMATTLLLTRGPARRIRQIVESL